MAPLEGLWWQDGVDGFEYTDKSAFNWISVIRLPDFATKEDFDWAAAETTRKKKLDYWLIKREKNMTFYERMRIVCMAIPAGKVATYGQIAMLCGKPKNSRQVGYGLKNDLAGRDVPAFRIVNGKGELSGACHFQIPGLQQALLQDEGIEVFWNGNNWCVDLKKYGWKNSIEEAEAFRREFGLDK